MGISNSSATSMSNTNSKNTVKLKSKDSFCFSPNRKRGAEALEKDTAAEDTTTAVVPIPFVALPTDWADRLPPAGYFLYGDETSGTALLTAAVEWGLSPAAIAIATSAAHRAPPFSMHAPSLPNSSSEMYTCGSKEEDKDNHDVNGNGVNRDGVYEASRANDVNHRDHTNNYYKVTCASLTGHELPGANPLSDTSPRHRVDDVVFTPKRNRRVRKGATATHTQQTQEKNEQEEEEEEEEKSIADEVAVRRDGRVSTARPPPTHAVADSFLAAIASVSQMTQSPSHSNGAHTADESLLPQQQKKKTEAAAAAVFGTFPILIGVGQVGVGLVCRGDLDRCIARRRGRLGYVGHATGSAGGGGVCRGHAAYANRRTIPATVDADLVGCTYNTAR